jgi:monoamine oxidase
MLEGRDRVGGRVWSVPFAGATAERGAEFVMPEYAVMRTLTDRFGLRLVRKGTLYGHREPRGVAGVTLDEVGEGLARVAGMPRRAGEDVAGALRRAGLVHGVREAIAARVEVSCTVAAGDLDESALHEGAGAFGDFATHTIEGGNDVLARALASELGDRLRLSAPVHEVHWGGDAVRVSGPGVEAAADRLVLAIPASVTDEIGFDPPLPPAKRRALADVRVGHAAKLFVRLSAPAPPSATLSVPERYWCYTQLGADGAPLPFVGAFAGTAEALAALAVQDGPERWLRSLAALRPDLALDPGEALVATWSDDPWVRGSYSARSTGSPLDTAALAAPVGPIVFAGEHTAGEWHGLMEGGLRSGIRAARQLLEA